jgi:hypothetical protein
MSWGGKIQTRMGIKQRNNFFRHSNRALPPKENPLGVPRAIMKVLSQEQLSSDPVAFNARLQQLLKAYKLNGG